MRLDGGPRLPAQIVDAGFEQTHVGQRVKLAWDTVRPEQRVYQFEPAR